VQYTTKIRCLLHDTGRAHSTATCVPSAAMDKPRCCTDRRGVTLKSYIIFFIFKIMLHKSRRKYWCNTSLCAPTLTNLQTDITARSTTPSQCPKSLLLVFFNFIISFFKIPLYQSSVHFGCRISHVILSISRCLQDPCFLRRGFGDAGGTAARQPLAQSCCSADSPHIKLPTFLLPVHTYNRLPVRPHETDYHETSHCISINDCPLSRSYLA